MSETMESLTRLRNLIAQLTQDVVDDPEELLTELAEDAQEYVESLDEVLERVNA